MSTTLANDVAVELSRRPGCEGLRLDRQISLRDNSVVYRASIGGGRAKAAVKFCRVPGTEHWDPAGAARQFDALRRVHEAFKLVPPQFTVPAPLCLSREEGAYAMSWVQGESLTDRLRGRARAVAVIDELRSAGAWLANFHRVGPQRVGIADIDSKSAHLLAMAATPVLHPVFRQALSELTNAYPQVRALGVHISWLHGDCKADNLLLTGTGLCGIDLDLRYENAVEHDLAQFLNHVDLLAGRTRYWHRRPLRKALNAAFLHGYRSMNGQVSDAVLHWLRLWGVTTYWHTAVAEGSPAWPKRWLLNRLFAGVAGSLLASSQST